MSKYTIAMYDLEDNLITVFDSYRECARYFKTSIESIHCYICRSQKGIVDKKLINFSKELQMYFNPILNKDIKIDEDSYKNIK